MDSQSTAAVLSIKACKELGGFNHYSNSLILYVFWLVLLRVVNKMILKTGETGRYVKGQDITK